MKEDEIIWYVIFGAGIYFLLFGWVIALATSNAKKNRYLEAQTEILFRIASNIPMTKDEIDGMRNILNKS